jgi:hypothetical protein
MKIFSESKKFVRLLTNDQIGYFLLKEIWEQILTNDQIDYFL